MLHKCHYFIEFKKTDFTDIKDMSFLEYKKKKL